VFILRVNRVGSEERQDFYGKSFCVGPEGELLGSPSGMNEGIFLTDVDLREIARSRKDYPFFTDRQPRMYEEICNRDLVSLSISGGDEPE